jgi:hypothetical protein
LLLFTISLICSCGQKDNNNKTSGAQQSTPLNSTPKFDNYFSEALTLLKESNLRDSSQIMKEFRFFYIPAFESYKFLKLNWQDSSMTIKEFLTKKPDGSGVDTLLSSKTIKFGSEDFVVLGQLIDKSMFWSLEPNIISLSIDGSLYIYECRQLIRKKMLKNEKVYHIVRCTSPKNTDFANLGQFLLFKAGFKNSYQE